MSEQTDKSAYPFMMRDPYAHYYDKDKAYESYIKLSSKYPMNPHKVTSDFASVEKVMIELKNRKNYEKGTIWA